MAVYYNCIGTTGVEVNRGETVSNFTKWKALKYLMKDPVELWDSSIKAKVTASYGVNMGGGSGQGTTKVLEGLRLLKEMLYSEVGKNLMVHLFISFRLFMIIKQYLNFLNGTIKVTLIEYLKCLYMHFNGNLMM